MTEQPDEQVTSLCNPEALVPRPEQPYVKVQISEFKVSILDEEDPNYKHLHLTVVYRGRGKWAVARYGECLSSDGTWDHEPMPSNRTDEWIATHRFDELTALSLGMEAAMHLEVMGLTALEARRRWEERNAQG